MKSQNDDTNWHLRDEKSKLWQSKNLSHLWDENLNYDILNHI